MTNTAPVASVPCTRRALASYLSTATCETATGQRVRGLLGELVDIDGDREMAARFAPETTRAWLVELAAEERDVWDHIHETLTAA